MRRASVIINNYNYGRFLPEAIDSALAQTHSDTEVVVVDDGSTDNSPEIIRAYGSQVVAVLQANGGQAAAVNAGFSHCNGEVVLFLDSDDLLRSTAIEAAEAPFADPAVVKVQWRQLVTDAAGSPTGRLAPKKTPPDGDLWDEVVRHGPDQFAWPALSGNAWSRDYLECLCPVPELYRRGVDNYLFQLAPFFGRIETLAEPQTLYRSHDEQISRTITFDRKLKRQLRYYRDYSQRAVDLCRTRGIEVDLDDWEDHSWWCRLDRATRELDELLPAGSPFTLIDDDMWGLRQLGDRRVHPFTERNGEYWGTPTDDNAAIERVERHIADGIRFLVFAWDSFWWLDHFEALRQFLRGAFPCVLDNPRLLVFELTD